MYVFNAQNLLVYKAVILDIWKLILERSLSAVLSVIKSLHGNILFRIILEFTQEINPIVAQYAQ
jgi:hypothetical protein